MKIVCSVIAWQIVSAKRSLINLVLIVGRHVNSSELLASASGHGLLKSALVYGGTNQARKFRYIPPYKANHSIRDRDAAYPTHGRTSAPGDHSQSR